MKIKRRQWLMFGLAIVICCAIYINWRMIKPSTESGSDKVLGEAQYVSTEVEDVSEYFIKSRLTRQQSREDSLDLLESVIMSADSSESVKQQASNKKITIAANNEKEVAIENLIKAKGFEDCVAFIEENGVNIVVTGNELENNKVAQIQEIVVSQTNKKPSEVKIVEVKN